MTERPDKITVDISGETLRKLLELMPAVAGYAKAKGLAEPNPADVVGLAVDSFHEQVMSRATAVLRRGEPLN